MRSNLHEALRIRNEERKDPTLTFIGGLSIGFIIGAMIGAVVMGQHLLNILG